MQKKFIALAVAGLVSGAAFAQSNVTVYGIADAFYVYSKGDNRDFSGIQSGGLSGGRVGFKGEEALGNGLKAIFTYEFGSLNIDSNHTDFGTRQSFVGLSSATMGTLSLGRQYAPSFLFLGATSSNEVTIVNPSNATNGFVNGFTTLNTGGGSRWNNSVAYHTPVFGGFDARAIYSFGEQIRDGYSDASTDASQLGVGARYSNGPLYLTAMYQAILDNDDNAADNGNKAWAVGGAFDFKVVKLFANYIREKDERAVGTTTFALPIVATTGLPTATTTFAGSDITKKYWSVGLSVPVATMGSVNVEYSDYRVDAANDANAKGLGIGYNHFLSKRTTGYVNVSHIRNNDNSAVGFNGAVGPTTPAASDTRGDSNTAFAVGVRHVF